METNGLLVGLKPLMLQGNNSLTCGESQAFASNNYDFQEVRFCYHSLPQRDVANSSIVIYSRVFSPESIFNHFD